MLQCLKVGKWQMRKWMKRKWMLCGSEGLKDREEGVWMGAGGKHFLYCELPPLAMAFMPKDIAN